MRTDAVVENEIFSEFDSKEPQIVDSVTILGNELFLHGSVITLHTAVRLGAMRVAEPMFDL